MAFPLTFPTYPVPSNVRVHRRTAAAVVESPTTYTQQVYQHPGEQWIIDVTIQKCTRAQATVWAQFFYDIKGRVGTFNFNLTPHCADITPAPGIVLFRMADPIVGWDAEFGVLYDFTFRAVQAQ